MGKSVQKSIKSRAEVLLEKCGEKFSKDFENNKKALKELDMPLSKTDRNVMAGYIARRIEEAN